MRVGLVGLAVSLAILVAPTVALAHPGQVRTDAEHIAEEHCSARPGSGVATHATHPRGDRPRRPRSCCVAVVANEHVVGRWGVARRLACRRGASALLPNGKVLAYYPVGDRATETFPVHNFTRATVWDPETGTHTNVNGTGYNVFCSGLAHLMDGNLFLAGGNRSAALDGIVQTHVFNYQTNILSLGPNMAAGRWYPTVTPLRNGEMLITEGGPDIPEVRKTDGSLRRLTTASLDLPLYPWIHVAPDGRASMQARIWTMRT